LNSHPRAWCASIAFTCLVADCDAPIRSDAAPCAESVSAATQAIDVTPYQSGLIAGRVVDASTGTPLAGAMVTFRDADFGVRVLTDSLGRFELPYAGASRLRVLAIGFMRMELELDLSPTEGCYAEIRMVPAAIPLDHDVF
jgi:Carboxypeptidase regulatory-like domain